MATQQPAQGTGKQKRRGFFPHWARVVAFIFTLIFLIVAATFWIWKVWGDISATMTALFTALGVIFALLALLSFIFPSDNPRPDPSHDPQPHNGSLDFIPLHIVKRTVPPHSKEKNSFSKE